MFETKSLHSFIEWWNEKKARVLKQQTPRRMYRISIPLVTLPTNIHLCHKYKNNVRYKYPDVDKYKNYFCATNTKNNYIFFPTNICSPPILSFLSYLYFYINLCAIFIFSFLYLCVIMKLILYLPGRQSCPLLQAPSFVHNNTTFLTT